MKPLSTIEERRAHLKSGAQLSVAIKGKYTNLRIWTGRNENGKHPPETHNCIFMRVDKYSDFSVPITSGHLFTDSDLIKT
jgi:hypothetical protein